MTASPPGFWESRANPNQRPSSLVRTELAAVKPLGCLPPTHPPLLRDQGLPQGGRSYHAGQLPSFPRGPGLWSGPGGRERGPSSRCPLRVPWQAAGLCELLSMRVTVPTGQHHQGNGAEQQ